MNNILEYSAICTKIKAMEAKLLNKEAYNKLIKSQNVKEALTFINDNTSYNNVFKNIDIDNLHRPEVERILTLAKYQDYSKLYRFASQKQRQFLKIYMLYYETYTLKIILRYCVSGHISEITSNDAYIDETVSFFSKYSDVDFKALLDIAYTIIGPHSELSKLSQYLDKFIDALKGTVYYAPLYNIYMHDSSTQEPSILDYELCIDMVCFKSIWKIIKKNFKAKEQDDLKACIGSSIDLANIDWIYRSKRYYDMSEIEIYSILIPIHHKLSKQDIKNFINTRDQDDFKNTFLRCYYGLKYPKLSAKFIQSDINFETLSKRTVGLISSSRVRKSPYSIVSINNYLYRKEIEISNIIRIIESIKYELPKEEILKNR